ncbi:MAG: hypothetical protein HY078_09310 [Elusimicrobia bacterium]|nr:hypothetical protein [Elusimicrobiota bacterium]
MTTRAEGFLYSQERSGLKKAKGVLHQRRKTPPADATRADESGGNGFLNRRDRSKGAARTTRTVRRGGWGPSPGR